MQHGLDEGVLELLLRYPWRLQHIDFVSIHLGQKAGAKEE
jgi:hypothetical protein